MADGFCARTSSATSNPAWTVGVLHGPTRRNRRSSSWQASIRATQRVPSAQLASGPAT